MQQSRFSEKYNKVEYFAVTSKWYFNDAEEIREMIAASSMIDRTRMLEI
jgi:hypothetical protein